MNPNLLTHAQMALERNDLFEASQLFRLHVTHFPDISAGWLGLFQSSQKPAERLECLEQLMRITQAENLALGIQPAQAVADDEAFEAIVVEPDMDFEAIQPYSESTTTEDESDDDPGTPAYQTIELVSANAIPQAAPGWPTIKAKVLQQVTLGVKTANRWVSVLDNGLTPVANELQRKIKTHPYFAPKTTQFSTSFGYKLRRVPAQSAQRAQKIPKVLNWVSWVIGIVVLGFVAAAVAPVFIGNKALVIISGSMVPAISTGSVVVVKPIESSQLNVGDVIAYSPNPGSIPLVHRIINIRDVDGIRYFTTQGDANQTADPKEVSLPPSSWKLWYSLPYLGYLINFTFSRAGFFIFVLIPLLGLGAITLKDRFRQPAKGRMLRA